MKFLYAFPCIPLNTLIGLVTAVLLAFDLNEVKVLLSMDKNKVEQTTLTTNKSFITNL